MTIPKRAVRTLLAALVTLTALASRAQDAYVVRDLNDRVSAAPGSSQPFAFFPYNGRVLFTASEAEYDVLDLWSTDGTAAGTTKVAAVAATRFTLLNGKLLFNGTNYRGQELWSTDGTPDGTSLIADISGPGSSSPGDRVVYHGRMFFAASEDTYGRELWVTDGTPAGTMFFKDLVPGAASSNPAALVVLNDTIYFTAANALWKSDGTPDGTQPVTELGAAHSLTVGGGHLFFTSYSPQSGSEPWVSDGTAAGTHMLADTAPGTEGVPLFGFRPFSNGVLFVANDATHGRELWFSDGTSAGTHILRDINPGAGDAIALPDLALLGDVAYFAATDGRRQQLWRTDGTASGTIAVTNINDGTDGGSAFAFASTGQRLFFLAGPEHSVWTSDGTAAGTHAVTSEPVPVTTAGGFFGGNAFLTPIGSEVWFSGANPLNGYELWKSDGTAAGTAMIANLVADDAPSSLPENLIAAGDWVYFDAWDGSDLVQAGRQTPRSLFRSDGTAEGTVRLADGLPGEAAIAAGHTIFFKRSDDLWISDGTAGGTHPAADFNGRFPAVPRVLFVSSNNTVYASISRGGGNELYAASAGGSGPAQALGVSSDYSFGVLESAGRVFVLFARSLWTTDGTAAGTHAVVSDLGGEVSHFAAAGGLVYVDVATTSALWRSDGTFEGSFALPAIPGGSDRMVAAGRNLFVASYDQLWVTDGTVAGTRMLPVNVLGATMAAAGDRVVFAAQAKENDVEPWVSDGTPEGTQLLRDIVPGPSGSYATGFTAAGGRVYFNAYEPLHGQELWSTDGTAAGTRLDADIEPGPESGYPRELVAAGERLFFTAFSHATGGELWALPLPGSRLRVGDARASEGATVAHFAVTLSSPAARSVTVNYLTSDGEALAGSDYDAVSGTLIFAPGETVKSIDVPLRADAAAEINERFFMTLRDAGGATMEKPTAAGVIEDDDQSADLGLSLDFTDLYNSSVIVNATNMGSREAAGIVVRHTVTPGPYGCLSCTAGLRQLAPGATAEVLQAQVTSQEYHSVTVTSYPPDPQPANNTIGWTSNSTIAMDALSLTPGASAHVWVSSFGNAAAVTVQSSNPAVLSVPASVPWSSAAFSFVVQALAAGSSTIRVTNPTSGNVATLKVDVFSSSAAARWPAGLDALIDGGTVPIDQPTLVRIYTDATAPFSGERPTGLVTVLAAGGRELARTTLTAAGSNPVRLPVYLPELGTNTITVNYAGDRNYLSTSLTRTINVSRGYAALTANAERSGTSAAVHIRANGSPFAPPTGLVTVSEPGVVTTMQAALVNGEAVVTLSNLSAGTHPLTITYAGDGRYDANTQDVRLLEQRRRGAQH
jgi:ELWxxDGT repeat protein